MSQVTLTGGGRSAGRVTTRPADDLVAQLAADCAAYWKLDEESGDRAAATGGVTLVATGAPGYAEGVLGNAVDCAAGNYLSGATAAAVEGGAVFDTVGWVKFADNDTWGMVITKVDGSTREFRLYRYTNNTMYWTAGGVETTSGPTRLAADGWGFFNAGFANAIAGNWFSINGGTEYRKTAAATVAAGTSPFRIGRGDTQALIGQVDEVGLWHRVLRPVERAALYNGGAGVTYPFSGIAISNAFKVVTADVWDSENSHVDYQVYEQLAPLSRVRFRTSATSMTVYTYTNIRTAYSQFAHVGVFVNGTYQEKLESSANGFQAFTVVLAAGEKTVELVNGLTSRPVATILGTWVRDVTFNAAAVLLRPQAAAQRVAVYGDSIAVGGNATTPAAEGWASLLRADVAVAVEGYGYRSLYDDCDTAGHRAALVASIAALAPSTVWLAIGVNDYQLNKWSADDFEAAYEALLADLAAALPAADIYCQCPIEADTEAANTFGDTLGDYRTAISDAVTDSGVGTYVDASGWLNYPTGYSDGVHPNTAGHATYYAAVKAALGL